MPMPNPESAVPPSAVKAAETAARRRGVARRHPGDENDVSDSAAATGGETCAESQPPAASDGRTPDAPESPLVGETSRDDCEAGTAVAAASDGSTEKSVAAMVAWLVGATLTAGSATFLAGGADRGGALPPKPDPLPEPRPDPLPKPKPDPMPDPKPEPKPDPQPDPTPPHVDPKPDPAPDPTPPHVDPKPDPVPDPTPPHVDPKPHAIDVTLALAHDTGSSPTDRITRDAEVRVGGIQAGSPWEYRIDGGPWVEGQGDLISATAFGQKSGERQVEVRVADSAGNHGNATLAFNLAVEVAAPTARLVTDSGHVGDNLSNDPTVQVDGLQSGAMWEYRLNGGEWRLGRDERIAPAAFDGMADGAQEVEIRQTDLAGNQASTSFGFQLDRTAPTPAVPALVDDTGVPDDAVTSQAALKVGGLFPGATWAYRIDGGEWLPGGVDGRIDDAALDVEGRHQVEVRQTDAAGNGSDSQLVFTTDRHADAPLLSLARDTGTSGGDHLTRDAQVEVTGLEPGGRWAYGLDGEQWRTGTGAAIAASEFGGDGEKTVWVQQTDAAGNISATSVLKFTLDTTAAAPTAALHSAARDNFPAQDPQGADFYGSNLVNAHTWLQLGLEPGASWTYRIDGSPEERNGEGARLDLAGLSDGAHEIRIHQVDVAGNTSVDTVLELTMENTAPVAAGHFGPVNTAAPAAPDWVNGLTIQADEAAQIVLVPVGVANDGTAQSYLENGHASATWVKPHGATAFDWSAAVDGMFMVLAIDTAGNASFASLSTSTTPAGLSVPATETRAAKSAPAVNIAVSALDDRTGTWQATATMPVSKTEDDSKTDHLFGTSHADHFVWGVVSNSLYSNSQIDWIHGYDPQQGDVIDIDDPAFETLNAGVASEVARYFRKEVLADGTVSLWIDKDGLGQTYRTGDAATNFDQQILVSATHGTDLTVHLANGGSFVL